VAFLKLRDVGDNMIFDALVLALERVNLLACYLLKLE